MPCRLYRPYEFKERRKKKATKILKKGGTSQKKKRKNAGQGLRHVKEDLTSQKGKKRRKEGQERLNFSGRGQKRKLTTKEEKGAILISQTAGEISKTIIAEASEATEVGGRGARYKHIHRGKKGT